MKTLPLSILVFVAFIAIIGLVWFITLPAPRPDPPKELGFIVAGVVFRAETHAAEIPSRPFLPDEKMFWKQFVTVMLKQQPLLQSELAQQR